MCQKEIVICNELIIKKLSPWNEDNVDQVWTFLLILSYSSICRSEIEEVQVHIIFQNLIRSYVGLLFCHHPFIDGGGGWSHGCIIHKNRKYSSECHATFLEQKCFNKHKALVSVMIFM